MIALWAAKLSLRRKCPLANSPASSSLQVGGCWLNKCQLWQGWPSRVTNDGRPRRYLPLPTLSLLLSDDRPMPAGSLARLLSMLLQLGNAPRTIQCLHLGGCVSDPAALAGCTQLQQLQELDWGGRPGVQHVAALLQHASQLSSLEIRAWPFFLPPPAPPPAYLASCPALVNLTLVAQGPALR